MKKQQFLWDKMAKSFHETSIRSKAHRDKYEKIADLLLRENPKKILDLGCGSGILEKELYDRGYKGEVVAIDASQPMLAIARELVNDPRCKFLYGDLDDGIPAEDKYDQIVSINLFFFLNNKAKFLDNVATSLKGKKSHFFMVTPKPNEEASNFDFIREHFSDTNWWEKIIIFINEISNIRYYWRMAKDQAKVSSLANSGEITFDRPQEVTSMAKAADLDIIKVEDIHAKQNWLFIMRRV